MPEFGPDQGESKSSTVNSRGAKDMKRADTAYRCLISRSADLSCKADHVQKQCSEQQYQPVTLGDSQMQNPNKAVSCNQSHMDGNWFLQTTAQEQAKRIMRKMLDLGHACPLTPNPPSPGGKRRKGGGGGGQFVLTRLDKHWQQVLIQCTDLEEIRQQQAWHHSSFWTTLAHTACYITANGL